MELQLGELEVDSREDELAADFAAKTSTVRPLERNRLSRKTSSAVIAAPTSCPAAASASCQSSAKTLPTPWRSSPRWKVIQTVREKFICRECEKISRQPASFHVRPRGFAGPNLLAMVLFEKFAPHQPLNRESERYAREGIDLRLSRLANQVEACAAGVHLKTLRTSF